MVLLPSDIEVCHLKIEPVFTVVNPRLTTHNDAVEVHVARNVISLQKIVEKIGNA